MGAGQAMQIGMTNLDKFAYVGAFSGGTRATDIKTAYDGAWADAPAFNDKMKCFYISVGTKENVKGARDFHKALEDAGIKHEYFESEGTAHEWQTWRRSLHDFAPRLFQGSQQTAQGRPGPPRITHVKARRRRQYTPSKACKLTSQPPINRLATAVRPRRASRVAAAAELAVRSY